MHQTPVLILRGAVLLPVNTRVNALPHPLLGAGYGRGGQPELPEHIPRGFPAQRSDTVFCRPRGPYFAWLTLSATIFEYFTLIAAGGMVPFDLPK